MMIRKRKRGRLQVQAWADSSDRKHVACYMDGDTERRLKRLARKTNKSISLVAFEAIIKHLGEHE